MPKSGEIQMFVCNQVAKSHEILMFVCLQNMPNNAVMPQSLLALIVLVELASAVSTVEQWGITALFFCLFGDKLTSESHET